MTAWTEPGERAEVRYFGGPSVPKAPPPQPPPDTAAADQAAADEKKRAALRKGRRSTVLTSPMGDPEYAKLGQGGNAVLGAAQATRTTTA